MRIRRRHELRSKSAASRALSVPSPLVGEGQGGGCHTGILSAAHRPGCVVKRSAPLPGLPLSLTLPHKGGGNALHSAQPPSPIS
ncbi:hypothetical protein E4K64_17430 [Bradyrhizobium frederickii]|uniref:Uncharacterized protein n=1 Tax=Bradyrhizobium frederickii TaxID=2560054 RepID=A0A4Y9P7H2_9BRAD|nr:hypothetical protein E4K64_17430 [Bradyrhizobium frederickii]